MRSYWPSRDKKDLYEKQLLEERIRVRRDKMEGFT